MVRRDQNYHKFILALLDMITTDHNDHLIIHVLEYDSFFLKIAKQFIGALHYIYKYWM